MTDKSYVTLEQKLCIVCNKEKDTNNLLFDTHLQNRFERQTTTGTNICDDCKPKDGYLLLIEIDPQRSELYQHTTHLKPQDAWKTGVTIQIRRTVFEQIFDVENPGDIAYIEPEVTNKLRQMVEKNNDSE